MLVRTREELRAAGHEVALSGGKARTVRLARRADRLGFSLTDVRNTAAVEVDLWYKNHWEANYVLAGEGDEMHDAEGTIPPSGPLPPGPKAA